MEVNPDALDIAEAMGEERNAGLIRSPLHGIPVIVKDNIATKDKMQTTAGSWALLGSVVPRDAFVVKQLREAGDIIIGHTSLTEWVSLRSKYYSDGYSPRRGQVRKPYDLSKSPCKLSESPRSSSRKIYRGSKVGSSGGSAVSVITTNMVPLAFATETDGSIIGQAQINGLVGIKPTPGLTSRKGVIPSSETMDTVGSIGRCMADAVIGLDLIIGADPADARTTFPTVHREGNYSQFLATRKSLKGAKFSMPIKRCWDFVPDDQKKVVNKLLHAMEEAGAQVIPVDYPCANSRIAPNGKWNWNAVLPPSRSSPSFRPKHTTRSMPTLPSFKEPRSRVWKDIIQFNKENASTEGASPGDHQAYPTGQDVFERIAAHKGVEDGTYFGALSYTQRTTRQDTALTLL